MTYAKQVFALVTMALASTRHRLGPSLVVTVGVGSAVLILVSMLSIGAGIESMAVKNVRADRVIVRQAGDGMRGPLTADQVQTIATMPGVERTADAAPVVSAQIQLVLQARKAGERKRTNITAMGMGPSFKEVHPEIRLTQGRLFAAGSYELIVGAAAQRTYRDLRIGDHLTWRGARWRIVGVFEANGGLAESWLLGDAQTLSTAFGRTGYDELVLRLTTPAAFDAFAATLRAVPQLDIEIKREAEVRREQARGMNGITNFVSYFVAAIMAIGATMGALNCMYALVEGRRREIATLQAIGFTSYAVFTAFLIESLMLSIPGGLIGIALPWLAINGSDVSLVGLNFALQVNGQLALLGVLWASAIALLGGALPAMRAAGLPLAQALRG